MDWSQDMNYYSNTILAHMITLGPIICIQEVEVIVSSSIGKTFGEKEPVPRIVVPDKQMVWRLLCDQTWYLLSLDS